MSGSKSKTKGKTWEREVSTFLSNTYSESFTRVAHSGAFVGGKNMIRKQSLDLNQIQAHKGDIFPPETWRRWSVECKNYADFPFHQLFSGDVKILDQWIAQTYDASDNGDLNLILIKINRKGKWVVYENHNGFSCDRGVKYKDWTFCSWDDFWNDPRNIATVKDVATRA